MTSLIRCIGSAVVLSGLLGGCTSIDGSYTPADGGAPARAEDCHVEVYRLPPSQPYTVVSRITVHVDRTHFLGRSIDEPMPELLRQACRSGADAVTNLSEELDSHSGSDAYTLTAEGIQLIR